MSAPVTSLSAEMTSAAMSSTSTPDHPFDSQAPAVGCHCLCHVTSQAIASPIVTPVIFNDSLRPPRDSTAELNSRGTAAEIAGAVGRTKSVVT